MTNPRVRSSSESCGLAFVQRRPCLRVAGASVLSLILAGCIAAIPSDGSTDSGGTQDSGGSGSPGDVPADSGDGGPEPGDGSNVDPAAGNGVGDVSSGLCAEAGSSEIEMQAASRTSGVAPLAVHFSAVGDGKGVIQPPGSDFDELHYVWSFGDSDSGNWAIDGHARNCASGFVSGHVFVDPGTYTVRLNVSDGISTHYYSQVIEVLEPASEGWTTYYVAGDGSDSASGTSEAEAFETFAHAMSRVGPKTRILLRRGDTWQAQSTRISTDGPTTIGAYGEAARPILRVSSGNGFDFSGSGNNRGWRFVGLHLLGSGSSSALWIEGVDLRETLVWDSLIETWGRGIVISGRKDQMDHNVVANTTIVDIRGAWTLYMGGTRSFVQGNMLDKQTTASSHTYRNWCANDLSLTHNYFGPAQHHCVKLHADREGCTSNVVISDNVFEGSVWSVGIGPQNSGTDERVRNVLYERNVHLRNASTQTALKVWARDVTIRNNVFINNTGGSVHAIDIEQRGIEPTPAGVRVCHNTFFAEQGSITPVTIATVASDTAVRNNLLAPTSGSFTISGTGSGLTQGSNLATAEPGFVEAGARNLALTPSSPAVGAGTDVGVLFDFVANPREGSPDVGAFELASEPPTTEGD